MEKKMNEKIYNCLLVGDKNESNVWASRDAYIVFADKKIADKYVEQHYPTKSVTESHLKSRSLQKWFDTLHSADCPVIFIKGEK